jgi:hypothetical protein
VTFSIIWGLVCPLAEPVRTRVIWYCFGPYTVDRLPLSPSLSCPLLVTLGLCSEILTTWIPDASVCPVVGGTGGPGGCDTFAAGGATVCDFCRDPAQNHHDVYRSAESSIISTVTVYCCGIVVHRSNFSF